MQDIILHQEQEWLSVSFDRGSYHIFLTVQILAPSDFIVSHRD